MATAGRIFGLTVDGVTADLRVTSVELVERMHEPFRAALGVVAVDDAGVRAALDLDELIGSRAVLEIQHDEAPRRLVGIVDAVEQRGQNYVIVVAHKLVLLADRVDYRVFVDADPLSAAKAVLANAGLSVDDRVGVPPAVRPQIVQAFESDLEFVRRLLGEEGIVLFVESTDGSETVVLVDGGSAPPIVGGDELPFGAGDEAGMVTAEETIFGLLLDRAVVTDQVTLRDYDFERPLLEQTVEAGSGPLEHYEFPAGYLDPSVGRALAERRLEELRSAGHLLSARSSCRRLAVGHSFQIEGAPREDLRGPWLVVESTVRGTDLGGEGLGDAAGSLRRFEAEIVAVPAAVVPRARRPKPPTVGGIQHATVTGPSGSEIHTDRHGRIKVRLRWDRLGKADDTASAWVRPVQPPTSGAFFLPRVGWEVMLGYAGTTAAEPYELGRLYNGAARPPEDLPGQKIRTNFGSQTSPGGGSENLLRMDDTAGKECMLLVASKDLNERTENDKSTHVKVDDILQIGADHSHVVGVQQGVTVTAAQSTSVGGNRDWSMAGALKLSAGSETISIGGLRLVQVGGDYETSAATMSRVVGAAKAEVAIQEINRHVTGVTLIAVGGSWTEIGGLTSSESVLGSKSLLVGGPMGIKASSYSLSASVLNETYASKKVSAGSTRVEAYGGAASYKLASLKATGAKIHVKADDKIVLDGAGAKITITPGKVVIDAALDVSSVCVVTGKYEAK